MNIISAKKLSSDLSAMDEYLSHEIGQAFRFVYVNLNQCQMNGIALKTDFGLVDLRDGKYFHTNESTTSRVINNRISLTPIDITITES